MKKLLVSVIALCFATSAHAAGVVDTTNVISGLTTKDTEEEFVIATVVKVDGIAWFDRMRAGVEQFAAETGQDAWMVGPSQADAAAQVQLIENLIAQGVDAICVVPFSVETLEPVLKKAQRRGVVVIAHEASNLKNADYIIEAFNNYAYGEELMRQLAGFMGEEGEYVATVGSLTSKSHREWMDGAEAYQKKHYPKMKMVSERLETYDDATTDYNKLNETLLTYPDLKGILGGPMPTSAGAGKLILEKGLEGKVFFAGTGLPSVAGKYLKDGAIQYIQFWDPAISGYAMNALAVMALSGQQDKIKAGLDLGLKGYTDLLAPDAKKPNLLFGTGWIGVTKANVDEYNF